MINGDMMTVAEQTKTYGFETEVKQILQLVIHSLYSNKEIFLRELISNASDAIDKLRFQSLENGQLLEGDSDLRIQVSFNEQDKTITIRDNGIGMTEKEVIENLGTIAKSGTKAFLESLTGDQAKDAHLIGQFGVGFYSAFIIADKVSVYTRSAHDSNDGVLWESNGEGEYTLSSIEKASRGTEVVLHLKDDETEFLNDWRLKNIIHKYSDHISCPIQMRSQTPSEDDKEKMVEGEFETINQATALWTRSKSDIKKEDYVEFYKHISHDFEEPLDWSHNHVEGSSTYTSLLYIPKKAPFDLMQRESKHGLKLFVKRVFIMDEAEQFMPQYLRFIKGVIDSSDLPLNVSRELLQENRQVETIRKGCVKRVLTMLKNMSDKETDKYQQFWDTFGNVVKEGIIEDFTNKDAIGKLLRFSSSFTNQSAQTVSLTDYVSRMKPDQKQIYYITAESFTAATASPHLEFFKQKDIEVLYLYDRIDEWLVSHLSEFEGKSLQSISKGALDLESLTDKEEKKEVEEKRESFNELTTKIQETLTEQVKEVRVTARLTTSPACLVSDEQDMNREMQRILAQAGQAVPEAKPILEINPTHPLVARLKEEADETQFSNWSKLLYDQALLAEGGKLDNPSAFVQRLNEMLLSLTQ